MNWWMNCTIYITPVKIEGQAQGCIFCRSLIFHSFGAGSPVRCGQLLHLWSENLVCSSSNNYQLFFRLLTVCHTHCLYLAHRVSFSTWVPVQSLTTANQQLLDLLDLMPRRRQQGGRALAALLTTNFNSFCPWPTCLPLLPLPETARVTHNLLIHCLSISSWDVLWVGYRWYIHITVYWEIFLDPCAPCVRSMLTLSVTTPSVRLCQLQALSLYQCYISYPTGLRREFVAGKDISNTWSFCLCSSLSIHVSALYNRITGQEFGIVLV